MGRSTTACAKVSSTTSPIKCRRLLSQRLRLEHLDQLEQASIPKRVDRSYDYPHVAAAYWVLYRLARNHQGLVTNHPWDWYLNQAYETSMAMTKFAADYASFGQMEGDIFLQILADLKHEGMNERGRRSRSQDARRAERWKRRPIRSAAKCPGIRPARKRSMPGRNTSAIRTKPKSR